jgi:parallel beta-helix repeat protein
VKLLNTISERLLMNFKNGFLLLGFAALVISGGCTDSATTSGQPNATSTEPDEPAAEPKADTDVVTFTPGPDAQKKILEELILAEAGTVFQFEEGTFEFTDGLSLTVDNVTIRGRGMDKTILSFKNQEAGAEGLYITSDNVLVEDIAIEDTKGNAIKSLKADNIVYRNVRTEWTGGPLSTNGAYGLYPVSSKNVTVDGCVAIGASDAGIYVGQSINVIVKNCRAEYNVAGIEIENCYEAEVFDCEATNNTGGILVFDLPDLPQQRGHNVRVYRNRVHGNNTDNFAPEGNIVGTVPAGTGVEVMANSNVEIFENEILNHGTNNILIVSYFATGKDVKDPNYYPYAEGIHIHHNKFSAGGDKPDNDGGKLMAAILGTPLPDIIWDGVVNEEKLVDGKLPVELRISIHDNTKEDGEVTFGNLGGLPSLADPANATPTRDLAPHREALPSVEPVTIAGAE